MSKEISIPVLKVENFPAAKLRRETYALTRDQQNAEFNDAIAVRLRAEIKIKCEKCGKEFVTKSVSDTQLLCPKCR